MTVLLDFYSDFCHPCKLLMKDLEEITRDLANLKIEKINITENYEMTEKYNVMSVPTLVILKNSEQTSYIGYRGKDDLKRFLQENI